MPNRVLRVLRIWQSENQRTWRSQFQNLIDATALEKVRADYARTYGEPLPYAVLIAKSVATAVAEFAPEHPELNSYLRRGLFGLRPHYFSKTSFGCTFSVHNPEGYEQIVVGVCEEPEKKSLRQIATVLKQKFQPDCIGVQQSATYFRLPWLLQKILAYYGEVSRKARYHYRGTFSYTGLGKFGIDAYDLPVSSTLTFGMGQMKLRPIVVGKEIQARSSFYLLMSIDRRLMNGQIPAQLLSRISQILENAEFARTATSVAAATIDFDEEIGRQNQDTVQTNGTVC